jgi:hypothetical protein
MNARTGLLLAAAALAAVVVVEEARIAGLRRELADLKSATPPPARPHREPGAAGAAAGTEAALATKRGRAEPAAEHPSGAAPGAAESLRRIVGNPAARPMMNQAHKALAGAWYADLIKRLDLTQSEAEHFVALLAGGMADQQDLGAKLLTAADDATRADWQQQLQQKTEAQEKAVREFLNDDGDFKAYQEFSASLPERQQLDGIRNMLKDAADPLTPEQESGLVDAMHAARTRAMPEERWGASQANYLAPDAEQRFERDWAAMQQSLRQELGDLLDPRQSEAFFRYQEMFKEMQLGSIRMARRLLEEGNPNAKPQ